MESFIIFVLVLCRAKDARLKEMFEKVFPELKKQREERER